MYPSYGKAQVESRKENTTKWKDDLSHWGQKYHKTLVFGPFTLDPPVSTGESRPLNEGRAHVGQRYMKNEIKL